MNPLMCLESLCADPPGTVRSPCRLSLRSPRSCEATGGVWSELDQQL